MPFQYHAEHKEIEKLRSVWYNNYLGGTVLISAL